MSSPADTELAGPQSSAIPRIFGLLALAVLGSAFLAAVFGTLRSSRWTEADEKSLVAREELSRLEDVFAEASAQLERRAALRARLPDAPESPLRVTQLSNLVAREAERPPAPPPLRSATPTRAEFAAHEQWLDALYRRVAAGRDIESRLPDLAAEIAVLDALLDRRSEDP